MTPRAAAHTRPDTADDLQLGEERYRQLIASVKDYAIFTLDPDGFVRTWNTGAEAIKGYTAEEIYGHHFSEFYPPEDRAALKPQRLLEVAQRDGRVEDEGWRLRKDGSRFWADVVITAIRDDRGALLGFAKVTRDLTSRRAAEDALRLSEQRFRLLVQSVRDYAIFMLDPTGRVVSWNAGAERIKGYRPEEIIGKHFSRFYVPEEASAGKCERALERAAREGKFEEEGWRLRKDGTRFWASVVIEPVRDVEGTLLGFGKVTRDLTERRRADEERVQLLQAQEAVRLRDEFLSIASHELKTPLSAVQLQLERLLRSTEALDEKTRLKAQRALNGAARLNDLIEALLDVSRIATGKLTLKRTTFDLSEAATDVVDRFRDTADREGCPLTLRADAPVIGTWDRLRLEQVITNLLGNAFRYAAGQPVEVEVTLAGDEARFSVSDRGPGIPASERERVFGRFERATSFRHFGGLGLGLYVSRQIAEAHGGRISVEAVEPTGARFVVTLPRSAAGEREGSE